MGIQALEGNGITAKIIFLARDKALTPATAELKTIKRRSAIWIFTGIEIFGFAATFAITQTIAAVGFPVFILALIPIRALVLPRFLSPEELAVLDAPTASPFTMEGIGGAWGGREDGDDDETPTNEEEVTPSAQHRRSKQRDSVVASAGEPRMGQGGVTELWKTHSARSTATRRQSVDRRTVAGKGESSREA